MSKSRIPNNLVRPMRRYTQWLQGQRDRLDGQPCRSNNGSYLDGWYSPNATIPEFLTHGEAVKLRRLMPQ